MKSCQLNQTPVFVFIAIMALQVSIAPTIVKADPSLLCMMSLFFMLPAFPLFQGQMYFPLEGLRRSLDCSTILQRTLLLKLDSGLGLA